MITKKWIPERGGIAEDERSKYFLNPENGRKTLRFSNQEITLNEYLHIFDKEIQKLNTLQGWLLPIWWQYQYLSMPDIKLEKYPSLEDFKENLSDTHMESLMRHTIEQYEKVRMMFEIVPDEILENIPSQRHNPVPRIIIMFPSQDSSSDNPAIPSRIDWEVAYRKFTFSGSPQIYSGKSVLHNLMDKYSVQDIFELTGDIAFYGTDRPNLVDIISDWNIMSFELTGLLDSFTQRNPHLPVYPGDEMVSRYSPMRLATLLGFEDDDELFLRCTGNRWIFNPYISTDNELPLEEVHQGFLGITSMKIYDDSGRLLKYPTSPLHNPDAPIVVWAK